MTRVDSGHLIQNNTRCQALSCGAPRLFGDTASEQGSKFQAPMVPRIKDTQGAEAVKPACPELGGTWPCQVAVACGAVVR